ncbi:MAG: hypothetical protein HY330_03725 [Chloroflexi bacterium]|nr:hypothetical protein [Chloroflexota bacterium]
MDSLLPFLPLLLVAGKPEYDEYVAALKEQGRDPRLYPVLVSRQFYVADGPSAWGSVPAAHAGIAAAPEPVRKRRVAAKASGRRASRRR